MTSYIVYPQQSNVQQSENIVPNGKRASSPGSLAPPNPKRSALGDVTNVRNKFEFLKHLRISNSVWVHGSGYLMCCVQVFQRMTKPFCPPNAIGDR